LKGKPLKEKIGNEMTAEQNSESRKAELRKFLAVAIEAAREAGAIVRDGHHRPKQVTYKGDVDLVTETDKKSEAAIVSRLRHAFPDHAIVAEEGSGGAAAQNSPYTWYVDPLDGTTNFAHGFPCFAVSIGLLENGKPIVAAVLNPISEELFSAQLGAGAYLNDRRIKVSEVSSLSKALLATGFPTHKRTSNPNIRYYWEFTLRSHGVRRAGSAALDLCCIASGRFDGFWEFGLKSWDTAAGILLVQEAGGKISSLSGEPYRPGDKEILASNGLIHEEMQRIAEEIAAMPATQGPVR
jgi:myo-inositol-1(or 4)-monophosphatase